MDMTSIERWLPGPGELLEFTPTPATRRAAAERSTAGTGPSSIQAGHIRTAMDRRAKGVDWSPWLAFAFHAPAPLDREALCRAVTAFIRRHETLRTWFEGEVDQLERRIIGEEAVELEVSSLGWSDSTEQVRSRITERLATGTSPLSWPAFVVGAIDHGDGFTFYYGVDHSHTDGVSLMLGVEEIWALYERELERPEGLEPLAPLEPVGSYVAFSASERELEATLAPDSPAVGVWLGALAAAGFKLPSFPLPLGLEPGESTQSIRGGIDLADPETTDAFEQVARQAGGGMSAGLFAALSIVEHELTGSSRYLALNAVATRFEPIYRRSQGWFINLVPVAADLSEAETFAQRVVTFQAALEASKPAAAMPARAVVDAVTTAMGGGGVSATAVPAMISYLDMRRFPGAEHPALDQIVALGGPGNTGDVSFWINRKSDRTYVMAAHPDTPTAHASVATYLHALKDVIARTVEAALTAPAAHAAGD